MPDHKYNYIKPTLEKSTLSILSVDCSHRLSLAIINSFSKHKQRESLCYRIKTRFDTPAIRLKSPKKKNTGVEVGEENRKSRKREVLDFVPPPSAPTKDAYSRRFSHFGHVSAVSQEPRRRKLSFNFPRNSNKVARPGRVLGPGPCARPPPPLRPRQHFKLAFHWLVRRNFIYPPRRRKQPRFPSLKPRHGATTIKTRFRCRPDLKEKEKVSGERSWTSRTSYGLGSIVFSLLVADHLFKFHERFSSFSFLLTNAFGRRMEQEEIQR